MKYQRKMEWFSMIDLPVIQIDFWQLTASLLSVAIINKFVIEPVMDFLKKYYHKAKKHIGKMTE